MGPVSGPFFRHFRDPKRLGARASVTGKLGNSKIGWGPGLILRIGIMYIHNPKTSGDYVGSGQRCVGDYVYT